MCQFAANQSETLKNESKTRADTLKALRIYDKSPVFPA